MVTYPFAAVLFDLDGVVIDSMPLHRAVWAMFLRSHRCTGPSGPMFLRSHGCTGPSGHVPPLARLHPIF